MPRDITDLDVFIGGVVCKGFSLAGIRNPYDERNYLYLQQLRLVGILKPKILKMDKICIFIILIVLQNMLDGLVYWVM